MLIACVSCAAVLGTQKHAERIHLAVFEQHRAAATNSESYAEAKTRRVFPVHVLSRLAEMRMDHRCGETNSSFIRV